MSKSSSNFRLHLGLAALFLLLVIIIWTLPVLLAGYSYEIFTHHIARAYADTGLFSFADTIGRVLSSALLPSSGVSSAVDGRLSIIYTAFLSQWIPWSDTVMWSVACAITFAIGLWFYWYSVAKVFSVRTAWIALAVTAFMPTYFRQATWFDSYVLGFTFLFASIAFYLRVKTHNIWVAIIGAGLLFGAATSAKDVFLLFIPWVLLTLAWRKDFAKAALFLVCVLAVYMVPYIGDIRTHGYPVNQNIARLWPGADEIANESYLHLYPDPYTYFFDKEHFDQEFLKGQDGNSLYGSMADEKVILSYDLSTNFFRRVRLSLWILLHDPLSFIQRQTIGGVFMLLFLIPGCIVLYRTKREYALWFLGLILLMFFEIRFLLLYERDHFINIAWIIGLIAALGITEIGESAASRLKLKANHIIFAITLLVSLQLLQSSRYEFATLYSRSTTLTTIAQAKALDALPANIVVSIGSDDTTESRIRTLSDRTLILFREETLRRLAETNQLELAFSSYGVTHLMGYPEEINQLVRRTVPSIQIIDVPESEVPDAQSSGLLKVLVNLIR